MKRERLCPLPHEWWHLVALPAFLLLALLLSARPLHAQTAAPERAHPIYLPFLAAAASPASPAVAPAADSSVIFCPMVQGGMPAAERPVESIPVDGPPVDRPAAINGDLNLALRGFVSTAAAPVLIELGGETDSDPPQIAGLFDPPRLPSFVSAYCVHEWNWDCGDDGCRAGPIMAPEVTLLGLSTAPGEALHVPDREAEIYAGGFVVLVLYADETRITLKYTREDSPVRGYLVHVEDFAVEPWLLRHYRELDSAGRGVLPALRSGDLLGYASGPEVKIAVRDTGSFMDPRSRKDWWHGW